MFLHETSIGPIKWAHHTFNIFCMDGNENLPRQRQWTFLLNFKLNEILILHFWVYGLTKFMFAFHFIFED